MEWPAAIFSDSPGAPLIEVNCYPDFVRLRLFHSSKRSGLFQMTEPSSPMMNGLTNKGSSANRQAAAMAASLLR